MSRRLVIMTIAGLLAAGFVGVGLMAAGQAALGGFVLVGACLAAVLNVLFVRRSQRLDRPGLSRRRGAATGRTLAPSGSLAAGIQWESSWAGGGNVATSMGRMNATWPLAVLAAQGQTVVLRFRPMLLAKFFGVGKPFTWAPGDVITAYPVRGRAISLNRGLAIESTTTALAYFWTVRPEAILADLAGRGVPVDWTERFIRLWR